MQCFDSAHAHLNHSSRCPAQPAAPPRTFIGMPIKQRGECWDYIAKINLLFLLHVSWKQQIWHLFFQYAVLWLRVISRYLPYWYGWAMPSNLIFVLWWCFSSQGARVRAMRRAGTSMMRLQSANGAHVANFNNDENHCEAASGRSMPSTLAYGFCWTYAAASGAGHLAIGAHAQKSTHFTFVLKI